jgi:CRP-like cAMP-binding protein
MLGFFCLKFYYIISMYESLLNTMNFFADIPAEEEKKIIEIVRQKEYKKGEIFIHEGEIPDKFAYNLEGLFRYNYIDSKGNDYTKGFFAEGQFISSYNAMKQGRGSHFNIEVLEDSKVLLIRYEDWLRIIPTHPCWTEFLLGVIEKGFNMKELRERSFLLFDAGTRYKHFLQEFPGFDQRVKQHYIASYLGITPVTLSRIRRKMGVVNLG